MPTNFAATLSADYFVTRRLVVKWIVFSKLNVKLSLTLDHKTPRKIFSPNKLTVVSKINRLSVKLNTKLVEQKTSKFQEKQCIDIKNQIRFSLLFLFLC